MKLVCQKMSCGSSPGGNGPALVAVVASVAATALVAVVVIVK